MPCSTSPEAPLRAWARSLGAALCALGCLAAGCSRAPYPQGVMDALTKAGANRSELERVLAHYQAAGDREKYAAACYLITNMEGHSYALLSLCDSSEVDVELNVLDYPDYESLMTAVTAIEAERGELDYHRKDVQEDLEHVTADLLIENIDLAFHAWRTLPWAQHLSFADFQAYVLPYRGSNEPLESWRPHFLRAFADLASQVANPRDPSEATGRINDEIRSWFRFDPRYYLHPTDQGLGEMLATKLGRCEDMTNLAIYAMRANGLAVTSDYTPHWANAGNNHAWNAILMPDGRVAPFMGAEANPGSYQLWNKLAKVYRKTYAIQPGNLVFQKPEWEEVPGWLRGKNYTDVTADYQLVADVTVKLERAVPDSTGFAYLCVFNSGEWKAIHWGRINADRVTFSDMGLDIAYLPAFYVRKELVPAAAAFILKPEGRMERLTPRTDNLIAVRVASTTQRAEAVSTDGVAQTYLEPGREYEFFYWQDRWVSVGKKSAGAEPLVFTGVPAGALCWMVAEGSRKDERIFTIEDGKQIWW